MAERCARTNCFNLAVLSVPDGNRYCITHAVQLEEQRLEESMKEAATYPGIPAHPTEGPFIPFADELLFSVEAAVQVLRNTADSLYTLGENVPEQVVDARLDIMVALTHLMPALKKSKRDT